MSRLAGPWVAGTSRRAWWGRALLLSTLLSTAGCSSDSDIGRVAGTVTLDGQPVPAVPERIPIQFNAASTLQFEVVAGEVNVADFDLVSKGKIAREDGG